MDARLVGGWGGSRRLAAIAVSLALIGCLLAWCGGALAAAEDVAAPGSSPETALPIPSGPRPLAQGQRIWYGFQYAGDGSQILLDLNAAPAGSAGFAVYTPGDLETPVGRGSKEILSRRQPDGTIKETELHGGDLIWSGHFPSPGVYYVVVEQAGPDPSVVTLTATGNGVSAFPGPVQAPAPAAVAPAPAKCVPVPIPDTLPAGGPGSAPGRALSWPSPGVYLLPAGQRVWYAFEYKGDGSQILVDLRATPEGSANFAVYTPGDLNTPVGRGAQQSTTRFEPTEIVLWDGPLGVFTEAKLHGGDLIWKGGFPASGVYYVAVQQAGPEPSTITLGINGSGVTGGQPVNQLPGNLDPNRFCIPQPAVTPPEAITAGGPGSVLGRALTLPSSGSYLLPVGQRAWYAFEYKGGGAQVVLDRRATPNNSANFAVYTPSDLDEPVGRGTKQVVIRSKTLTTEDGDEYVLYFSTELYGGDLIWSGNFPTPGTYYVAVEQTGPEPSTITLKIAGPGVSAPPTP